MRVINRKMLGTICLAIATFLNPFGFDILVYKLTQLTNDYWSTMYMLYVFAALFFGFSYLCYKAEHKKASNLFLTFGLFLNPFGYDLIVFHITKLTNDYWMTISIMYGLAGVFFMLFIYLYDINPIKLFKEKAISTHNKLKN